MREGGREGKWEGEGEGSEGVREGDTSMEGKERRKREKLIQATKERRHTEVREDKIRGHQ